MINIIFILKIIMGISLKTHKLLWGRSGSKCAFEDCRNDLIADDTESDDESIIGDEAHIVSRKEDGPRGKSILNSEERDKYNNLILLCRKHHKIIDDQHVFYTVKKLSEIKKSHEDWIKTSLKIDKLNEKSDLAYASYIDEIVKYLDFESWNVWTSWTLGDSCIAYERYKAFEELPKYIISRFWPNTYIDLENVVFNIGTIVNDLIMVLNKYVKRESLKLEDGENPQTKYIYTEKFYKLTYHQDQNIYNQLSRQYEYHTDLIDDLIFELTRNCNLLIEKIRNYIYPSYREIEGKLLVTTGPHMDLSYRTIKLEFSSEEKKEKFQYKGLKDFMKIRDTRQYHFGSGVSENYFLFDPEKFFG